MPSIPRLYQKAACAWSVTIKYASSGLQAMRLSVNWLGMVQNSVETKWASPDDVDVDACARAGGGEGEGDGEGGTVENTRCHTAGNRTPRAHGK